MPISLTRQGLMEGAKRAADEGLSFHDYCEMVAKVIVSGQSVEEVKALLRADGIDICFGIVYEHDSEVVKAG